MRMSDFQVLLSWYCSVIHIQCTSCVTRLHSRGHKPEDSAVCSSHRSVLARELVR